MKKPPLVEVEWVDSVANLGWQELSDVETWISNGPKLRFHSAGYLISKTTKELTIALSVSPDTDAISGMIQIPRKCVKKIRRLT